MGYSIKGWPEGHPQLVTIDANPFGKGRSLVAKLFQLSLASNFDE
jgi:hypothetical protein